MPASTWESKPIGGRNYYGFEGGVTYNWFQGAKNFAYSITVAAANSPTSADISQGVNFASPGSGIGFLIGLLLIFIIEPAQAQFFNKTQTWLGGAIPGIDASLVALIFNVLRALFVIYLGIGLVKVIQSARNDDDWQQLARTPLILVVTVTMGDILAAVITGV